MYEIILKWGLDTLVKGLGKKDDRQLNILLEAIKTKNTLVNERFKYAYNACQSLIEMTIKLEDDLSDFRKSVNTTDGTLESTELFIKDLEGLFHPKYYREYKKYRNIYDCTNDLLASYSFVLTEIIHIDTFKTICKKRRIISSSDICRTYRTSWNVLTSTISSLIRLTSNDLRFWLTDNSYRIKCTDWAKQDLKILKTYLISGKYHEHNVKLSLEDNNGVNNFWNFILSI